MKVSTVVGALALVVLVASPVYAGVQCIGEDGDPVDWWVVLKVPYLTDNDDPVASSGYAYSYADANNQAFLYTGEQLNTNMQCALANTLNQIYDANSETGWMMYNDEDPSGSTHSSYGHTKGVVAFDSDMGYWLVHSTPRWPDEPPASYNFPEDEKDYGQHFFCQTYALEDFNDVGTQFILNKPYVYSSHLTEVQNATLPNMVSVLNHDFITTTPASNTIDFVTMGGLEVRSFAKNGDYNVTLYETIVEPGIDSGLLLETWQNGSGGKMPSFCTPTYEYDSMNVQDIQLTSSIGWTETKDHSKWGVSTDSSDWVCIGDINRVYSQDERGGGTECMRNDAMWKAFNGIISGADCCTSGCY